MFCPAAEKQGAYIYNAEEMEKLLLFSWASLVNRDFLEGKEK